MKIHEGKCTEKILKERERIGSRLAILRKKRNMTQEELANLCGVNRVNIAKIEKGAYNVSIDILSKVTSALGFCDRYKKWIALFVRFISLNVNL